MTEAMEARHPGFSVVDVRLSAFPQFEPESDRKAMDLAYVDDKLAEAIRSAEEIDLNVLKRSYRSSS